MDTAPEDHWRDLSEQILTGMRRVEAQPSESHLSRN